MIFKKRKTHRKKRRSVKRKKRNPSPAITLMAGNPRRRRYVKHRRTRVHRRTFRRNPSFMKSNITSLLMNGLVVAAGAGATMALTNAVNKLMASKGKDLSVPMKNMVSLAIGLGLTFIMPKLKLGKYAQTASLGAIGISLVNIASTSFGMSRFFSLAGETNPELDKIIANLNVSGEDDLEGVDLLGIRASSLLGMAETMSGEDDYSLLGIAESLSGEDDEF